ncbi:hypothetical protein CBM2626_B160012 [Cupriavidus taiwanensis]|nr:hypothetical protein CBM2626_B160012 [Cupriavidus taiwanensis]
MQAYSYYWSYQYGRQCGNPVISIKETYAHHP